MVGLGIKEYAPREGCGGKGVLLGYYDRRERGWWWEGHSRLWKGLGELGTGMRLKGRARVR